MTTFNDPSRIFDTHTIHVDAGIATEEQIETVFRESIREISRVLQRPIDSEVYVNLIRDRSGKSLRLAYVWVSNPIVYYVMLGRNPDGSARTEKVATYVPSNSTSNRNLATIPEGRSRALTRSQDRAGFRLKESATKLLNDYYSKSLPLVGKSWADWDDSDSDEEQKGPDMDKELTQKWTESQNNESTRNQKGDGGDSLKLTNQHDMQDSEKLVESQASSQSPRSSTSTGSIVNFPITITTTSTTSTTTTSTTTTMAALAATAVEENNKGNVTESKSDTVLTRQCKTADKEELILKYEERPIEYLIRIPEYRYTPDQITLLKESSGDELIPTGGKLVLSQAFVPDLQPNEHPNVLFTHCPPVDIPPNVITRELLAIFSQFSERHRQQQKPTQRYPFVKVHSNTNTSSAVSQGHQGSKGSKIYVTFNPATYEARFALHMCKKVTIKYQQQSLTLTFYHARRHQSYQS